jgi:hypothetical protein
MNILLFIFLIGLNCFDAHSSENEKGLSFGFGGLTSFYTFPSQFQGVTKNKVDNSSNLFGFNFNIGYDLFVIDRFVFGFYGEQIFGDTFGTGAEKNSTKSDSTTGRMHITNFLIRSSLLFDFKGKDMMADKFHLLSKIFVEGGYSFGQRSFSQNFTYNNGPISEIYKEDLEEDFQGFLLSAGVNLATFNGTFMELKVTQTLITQNTQNFHGFELVNGGSPQRTGKTLHNENQDSFTSILFTVGHHY